MLNKSKFNAHNTYNPITVAIQGSHVLLLRPNKEQKRRGTERTEAAKKNRGRRWLCHMEGRNSENRWKGLKWKKCLKQGCAHLRGHQWPPAWETWGPIPHDSLPAVTNTWLKVRFPSLHLCLDEGIKKRKTWANIKLLFLFTFTFSHFADTFIQSDLQLGNT